MTTTMTLINAFRISRLPFLSPMFVHLITEIWTLNQHLPISSALPHPWLVPIPLCFSEFDWFWFHMQVRWSRISFYVWLISLRKISSEFIYNVYWRFSFFLTGEKHITLHMELSLGILKAFVAPVDPDDQFLI